MPSPNEAVTSEEAPDQTDIETGPPVPRHHPGRWIAALLVLPLGAAFVHTLVVNPNFQWPIVGKYLFSRPILSGVLMTVELTLSAMAIGVALGIVAALMRLSDNKLLVWAAQLYIVCFRATPALVQLIFWFNISALFPKITLGIPFFGPDFVSFNANAVMTPFVAANLGLGLCEGAYMAEIVRGGIISVDPGESEAAAALGLSRAQTLRHIVLPQALRVIIPPTGNEVIGMLKYTSLASVISVTELLTSSELIYTRTFETIPLLIVASLWYVALTSLLTAAQRLAEARLSRGHRPAPGMRRRRFAEALSANLFRLRRPDAGKAWPDRR